MPKFILAQKVAMTRTFMPDGTVVPATRLKSSGCVVTQIKRQEPDGYEAVQIGMGTKRRLNKPQAGHLKASGAAPRYVREVRVPVDQYTVGQAIDVAQFAVGDTVQVTGVSKGKGFQGVVKRHGFHGHPTTHGHKDQARMPGSIGAGGVQHVRKGMRMAGHMGDEQVTVAGLRVVAVDAEAGELIVKGAVPGARNSLVLVRAA